MLRPGARRLRMVIGGGLGDCLLHTPFLRHFRKSGEYDHITCMAAKRALELLDHNPHIDQLIGCEVAELAIWAAPEVDCEVFSPYVQGQVIDGPDGSIAFQKEMGWKRQKGISSSIVRQVASGHGLQLADEFLEVFTAPEDEAWAGKFVGELPARPIVVLNRRASSSFKEYPRESWQRVVDALAGGVTVLEFSAPDEAMSGVQPVAPFLALRRTAALFRRVDCVVTVDSFFGHLAAAVGTPAVVVFGPTGPEVFGHAVNRNVRLGGCPPCYHPEEVGCREALCLTGLSPSTVVEAVLEVVGAC